jgi:hypothetical protein
MFVFVFWRLSRVAMFENDGGKTNVLGYYALCC